MADWGVRRLAA